MYPFMSGNGYNEEDVKNIMLSVYNKGLTTLAGGRGGIGDNKAHLAGTGGCG